MAAYDPHAVLAAWAASLVEQLRVALPGDEEQQRVDAVERLLASLVPLKLQRSPKRLVLPPVRRESTEDQEQVVKETAAKVAMTAPTEAIRRSRRLSVGAEVITAVEATQSQKPQLPSLNLGGPDEPIPTMTVIPTPGVSVNGTEPTSSAAGAQSPDDSKISEPPSGTTTPWKDMAPTPAEFTPEGLEIAKAALFSPKSPKDDGGGGGGRNRVLPHVSEYSTRRGNEPSTRRSRPGSRKGTAKSPTHFRAPIATLEPRTGHEVQRGFCFAVGSLLLAMVVHCGEAVWVRVRYVFWSCNPWRGAEPAPSVTLGRRRQTAALALMHNSEPPSQFIFLPGSLFIRTWEYGILLAILWVVVMAPLRLGFSLWGDAWLPFDVVVDLMFAMDIAISCNTAFHDPETDRVIAQRDVIARRYLSGGAFVIDFLSAFPFYAVSDSNAARVLLLLKPLRLTRVSFITSRSSRLGASTRLRQVTNIGVFAVIIHCIACAYWWIASGADADVDAASAWMPREEWGWMYERYADALHWTLTSTLKSGPDPETYGQYVFTCIVILIGEILKAYLIGSITEILTTLNLAEAEKKAQLDNVTTFLSRRRVDTDLRRRILEFFDYRWSVGYSVKEHEQLLGQLPAQLSLELSLELKRTLIDKVPMFANLKPEVVVMLAESLRPSLAVPDELIVVQGVVGTGMYFVNRGIVRIEFTMPRPERSSRHHRRQAAADDDLHSSDEESEESEDEEAPEPIEVMTTSVGSSFGEDSVVTRKPRIATARALTFCDMQRLSYRNFKRISEVSPVFKHAVHRALKAKSTIIKALRRGRGVVKRMGSERSVGTASRKLDTSSAAMTPATAGRFTRIAAEAMGTVRSPESSHRERRPLSGLSAENGVLGVGVERSP